MPPLYLRTDPMAAPMMPASTSMRMSPTSLPITQAPITTARMSARSRSQITGHLHGVPLQLSGPAEKAVKEKRPRSSHRELAGMEVEVGDQRGHHLLQGSGLAAVGHRPRALLRRQAAQQGEQLRPMGTHFVEQIVDTAPPTLVHTRLVPFVLALLRGEVGIVIRRCLPGADPDADQLAEVFGGDMHHVLSAGPATVAGVHGVN